MLKSLLLASAAALYASAALAQNVNQVPQVGSISTIYRLPTYTASSAQLVPAASATDIFCVNGSTTKNISVREFIISGTAGTAITTPVLVNYNHSLDTGGTAATGLALPVAVPTNPSDPASGSAAQTAYTANPTVNDSSPNLLAVVSPTFAVTTTANQPTIIITGTSVDMFNKGWDIPKASTVVAQICLNLDGKSISSGVLNVTAVWTEN